MTDKTIKLLHWTGTPLTVCYIFSMFIYPWIEGKGEWTYVQAVWDRWQSLNVGMLAFLASVIAFNISRYNFNKQRERDFIAARSFLPEALSDLCDYTEACIPPLKEAWNKDKHIGSRTPLLNEVPELPKTYKDIFKHCIALAPKEAGDHLAKILEKLQIQNSRLITFSSNFESTSTTLIDNRTVLGNINDLAELRWLIDQTFNYARGRDKFFEVETNPTNWDIEYSKLNLDGVTIQKIRELQTSK